MVSPEVSCLGADNSALHSFANEIMTQDKAEIGHVLPT